MKKFSKIYNSLCPPSKLYFVISILSILVLFIQNISNPKIYRVGHYSVPLAHHNMLFFIFKILYVVIWTYLLNQLCKYGYGDISWFLVLLPFALMFVLIGLLLLANIK
jgi:hypothetical protein